MVMSAVSSVSTPGRVGDGNAALHGGHDVDIVDAVAEIGDQLELLAGLGEHGSVDLVGHRRHQHVGGPDRLGQLGRRHRLVVRVEPGVEKFPHAQLDLVGQLAGHDHQRLLRLRHACSALFNRAPPHSRLAALRGPANPFIFLPDGRDNTKHSGLARSASAAPVLPRWPLVARWPCRRPPPASCQALDHRLGQRPAGAPLRQPEGRPRQCARRAQPRPGRALGLYPRRHAGGDHRRIRELAAHPRLGGGGRLGLPLAAVRQADRRGGAEPEGPAGAALRQRRQGCAGWWPSCRAACWGSSNPAPAPGANSAARASTAGCGRTGCGAPIRTRRSISSPAGGRSAPIAPPASPRYGPRRKGQLAMAGSPDETHFGYQQRAARARSRTAWTRCSTRSPAATT